MSQNRPVICPTVTASEPHEFRSQMERIAPFAHRIHIDLADGVFTSNKLIGLEHIWWPVGIKADVHMMYETILPFMDQIIAHHPHMVIVQAEAVGNFYEIARTLNKHGILVGVALLQHTKVEKIIKAINDIDHVLIFSGDLGHFGGHADLALLEKVKQIKRKKKQIEIGWDGGISLTNAKQLAEAGIDVLNVGGAIQRAEKPQTAYDKLVKEVRT